MEVTPDQALWVPVLTLVLVMGLWAIATRLATLHGLVDIPGPSHSFLLGAHGSMRQAPSFLNQQHEFLQRLHDAFGSVVKLVLPFGSGVLVSCSSADVIQPNLLADHQTFQRRMPCHDLPLSLASLPLDARWKACRAALALAFSPAAMRTHHITIGAHAEQLCTALLACDKRAHRGTGGERFEAEVSVPMIAHVLDAFAHLIFGPRSTRHAELANATTQLAAGMAQSAWLPLPLLQLLDALPTALRPAFRAEALRGRGALLRLAAEAYDDAFVRYTSQTDGASVGEGTEGGRKDAALASSKEDVAARKSVDSKTSLIEELARARVPRDAACEIAVGTLVHGSPATAHALCWAVLLLSRHAREQEAARAEVRAVCTGGGDTRGAFAPTEVHRLVELRAVWLEALRLFPPIPALYRVAARPCSARAAGAAVPLPRGTVLLHSIASAARAEGAFGDDAGEFRPSRHLGGSSRPSPVLERGGDVWSPFGGGARKCAGARLGEDLGLSFLAAMLHAFELSPPAAAADVPAASTASGSLGPAGGLRVRLARSNT